MRKFYSFLLTAFVMLFAGLQANAALTVNLQWNNPGSIEIWVGGTGDANKVSLPANATSYTATIDNTWGTVYFAKASGYEISSATINGTAVNYITSSGKYSVNMDTYNGCTAIIETEVLSYDSNFTIDVANGASSIEVKMWGSGRIITLTNGLNTIPYSTKFETGVDIEAPTDGSSNPVLKQHGVVQEWKAYYNWDDYLYHKYNGTSTKGFSFADGTDFYVKYNDETSSGGGGGGEDPQTPSTYTVNFNLTENGNAALNMIFNVSQFQSYPANETTSIEVNAGDQIRLSFNTQVYDVKINGSALESDGNTTLMLYTINENSTFTIDATPQQSTISLTLQNSAFDALEKVNIKKKDGSVYSTINWTSKMRRNFPCDKDKNYELVFNTAGYDVTVNNVAIATSNTQDGTGTYTGSGLNAATLNISAAVHIPTVNLSFTFPGSGRAALTGVYDLTDNQTLTIGTGVIEVVKDHQIRLDFDVTNYDVVFNGTAQTAESYTFVANENKSFTVNATVKEIERDPIVTLSFLTTEARLALQSINNNATGGTISTATGNFSVVEGTSITLTFNTTDYDVTVNGELLTQANNTVTLTIAEDTTINITADEHEDGATKVMVNFTFVWDGRSALTGLYDATKRKDLPILDNFMINQGNDLRLTLNTADYTIDLTIDGTKVNVGSSESQVTVVITGETNITLSAQRKAIVAPTSGILVHWNIADAVVLHVGSIADNALVSLPAGSTRYLVPEATWGNFYIEPLDGYVIKSVTCEGETLNPLYNSTRYSVNRAVYNASVIEVDLEAIVYDGTFTINLINGREQIKATMWGTNRVLDLHTGFNTYSYSTKFEPGVEIIANAQAGHNTRYSCIVDGVERFYDIYPTTIYDSNGNVVTPEITEHDPEYEFYILQDEEETAWVPVYGSLNNTCTAEGPYEGKKGYWFEEGKNFVVKYWNTDDPEEIILPSSYITFNFEDANAAASISMLYNITKKRSISKNNMIEVMQQDQIRIVFNTFDWDVYINGSKLTPAENADATAYVLTADAENITLNISVSERVYGTTTIGMYIADLNGVVLREGTIDGPIIDTTGLTGGQTEGYSYEVYKDGPRRSATVTYYTFKVSEKRPKIFVDEVEGYWIDAALYTFEGDTAEGNMGTPDYKLYVVDRKITPTTPMVVYLATNGNTTNSESLMLRDYRRNEYQLQEGYNEFMIDPDYVMQLSAMPLDVPTGTNFAVYNDMSAIAADDNGVYQTNLNGASTIHIFCGVYPTELNLNAYIEEGINAEIKVDRNRTFNATNSYIPVFQGAEIEISHADGAMMFLDNEQLSCDGDHTHLFTASNDHNVSIENAAVTLADAAGHTATVNKDVASVAYERELTPASTATWQAICLPFDVAYNTWSNAGYRVLALDKDQTLDGKIVFVEIGNNAMQHNTPYLVQTPADAEALTLAAENTTLYAKASTDDLTVNDGGLVSFVGTLTPVSLSNSDTRMVYGLKGGEFLHAGEGAKTMKAFRAYLSLPVASTQQTRMKIQAKGGEQTGIEDLTIENAEEGVFYNLKGQRVDNPESGLYIFNGQKVIIR